MAVDTFSPLCTRDFPPCKQYSNYPKYTRKQSLTPLEWLSNDRNWKSVQKGGPFLSRMQRAHARKIYKFWLTLLNIEIYHWYRFKTLASSDVYTVSPSYLCISEQSSRFPWIIHTKICSNKRLIVLQLFSKENGRLESSFRVERM